MAENNVNSDREEQNKLEKIRNKLDVNNTLILAIATLAITWCSYQSTLWGGIQTFRLEESNKWNRLAQEKNLITVQHQAMDQSIIIGFVNDVIAGRKETIDFYLPRLRPELAGVFKSWLASDPLNNKAAPPHPMDTKEYKELLAKDFADADKSLKKASEYWDQAQEANAYSDWYSLFAVIFSMIMFLGAITTKMRHVRLSYTIMIVSGLVCILILFILFLTMPFARE